MSDRETILRTIGQAQSRIRANRIIDRLARHLTIWVGFGLFLKLIDIVRPFAPGTVGLAWICWVIGAAGLVGWGLGQRSSQRDAAAEVDRRVHLKDEVLSAWWFISNNKDDGPWVGLHVRRTADKLRDVDFARLCPRAVPRLAFLASAGLVLLIALHFIPLPFSPGPLFSGPRPPLDQFAETETLMEEIEDLLSRAEALDPDGTLSDFQQLMNEVRDAEVTIPEVTSDLDDFQSKLDEGNLSTAAILEGLEDMAEELMGASDTAAAGEALAEGNLREAAQEFDQLADTLAGAELGSEDLAEALARAAEEARPGLDSLAESFEQASEGLEGQDSLAAAEALAAAADALRDLSDVVESQNLRNQASDRIDDLREALDRQAQGEAGETQGGDSGDPGEGEQTAPGEQEGLPGESLGEPGASGAGLEAEAGAGAQAGEGDAGAQGESGEGQDAAGQPGSIQGAAGGDTGLMPAGLGFSPEEKVGLATSLEVQLEVEATLAAGLENEPGVTLEPEEEASRQERSRLGYREIPSELTPAQQELLNQEQIPPEYRNLIREYFQAIRPPASP